ncbi:ABC transporter ATP-binding protein [Oceanobacillus halophilus]|uniref:ABC transporter ATP-binding protein n=1 Tax=Oceanobacillus halophilus TaxID=930130 RepID=A0A495A7T2_9BACI|nr:ABC transporter ATP-binding protein [Oceanobacillus halophilus]RKQ35837.1 ABC transporter ATP-binding protein [Oceanobacillus halophilus]
MQTPILSIENMDVSFQLSDGKYKALEDISFSVFPDEVVGIVGESGCGKSLTSQAILGILPKNAQVDHGEIAYKNNNLLEMKENDWQEIRGSALSMIFQEPMTALNPLLTVGKQISEVLKKHTNLSKKTRKQKTISMMKEVGLSRAEELYNSYPHQLSGGMQQRIVIAIALIAEPDLIIADEPTTALDVTIQAQILELFRKLKQYRKTSIIFISHDWGVIRHICDRVLVMYAGRIVEQGSVTEIISNPKHPYTKGLIQSIPDHQKKGEELYTIAGKVPSLKERKGGCPFADRCSSRLDICKQQFPESVVMEGTHTVKCHLYLKGAVETL